MSREIKLPRGLVAIVDDADYAWLSEFKWQARKASKTDPTKFYAMLVLMVGGRRKTVWMHRLVMGAKAGQEVDHRNRNGLDNRRANLREATRAQNTQNRSYPVSKTGYRGVHARGGTWRVCIQMDRRQVSFNGFESALQAAVAFDMLATREYGEFAVLNFDRERDWIVPVEMPAKFLADVKWTARPPLASLAEQAEAA